MDWLFKNIYKFNCNIKSVDFHYLILGLKKNKILRIRLYYNEYNKKRYDITCSYWSNANLE